jgi:hypothetical protein
MPGPYLRTALTGRASSLGADPGLHPGLVELALQAEIAGGSGQWAVRRERNVESGAVQSGR